MAALREVSRSARSLPLSQIRHSYQLCQRRCAATQAAEAVLQDLETDSTLGAPELSPEEKKIFRPWKRAADRKYTLPSSRYQYHPPKYNRGPLHPIQSPPSSDPIARDFVPGPFNLPRLRQTYQSTVASDLMTLAYNHKPPGESHEHEQHEETTDRLRGWDGSSPYHKNRQKRAPRGSPVLKLVERDITFRNIPEIKEITIATFVPEAIKEQDYLLVARTMLLAITGTTPEITKTKSNIAQWGLKEGERAGVKTTIYGNAAYEFLDRCIHIVFPRIKDWKGIKGTTGDGSGNLAWGFQPSEMAIFPEIEVNYAMYPSKMLPGCRVFVKTTATSDRQARLLLQALGIPFYGELRN
ncbi:ribosomal protein L5 domain-containing protein [Diplogelasinospora grovesii]|uniref:Ribosomal protein L5 domain-containing protein n=1 Tax=Diplogelasinospora grovesii TaxID=303347 RepID=A0AAN6S894_9PEZI|nr:ribosomal protein L5 domain-containing protein [Diplogelasinospora grovesii]